MCTVTFLPGLPGGGYLLATNRDESPRRLPALAPYASPLGGRLVVAPRDGDAGGTWIGVDERGFALCVLNGDRPPAAPPPPDAPSRGTLVLELLALSDAGAVRAELLARAEAGRLRFRPFKLVCATPGGGRAPARLARLDWDGRALREGGLDAPGLVVSSTFRPDEVQAAREAAFAGFLAGVRPALRADAAAGELDALADAAHDFHAGHAPGAPAGDAFSVCMHRADARTVSSTLVLVGPEAVRMDYRAGWPCGDGELQVVELGRG